MKRSPFQIDPSAALAAHARMPAGVRFRHLHDDPESREELRAEMKRMRSLRAQERARQRDRAERMAKELA